MKNYIPKKPNYTNKKGDNVIIIIGIIYLWFGLLKFFPGASPAEKLAENVLSFIFGNIFSTNFLIISLAILETGLGLLFILKVFLKEAITLGIFHIILTFTPLLFFPELVFNGSIFSLTLLGQYIVKNIIIIYILQDLRHCY